MIAMARRARLRMFALVRDHAPGTVAAWDMRTSMDDGRIALQAALGVPLDQLDNSGYQRGAA